MDTVICHLARECKSYTGMCFFYTRSFSGPTAISYMVTQPTAHIREDLTEKCSSILLGYRRNCATATRQSQVSPLRFEVSSGRLKPMLYCHLVGPPRSIPSFATIHTSSTEV